MSSFTSSSRETSDCISCSSQLEERPDERPEGANPPPPDPGGAPAARAAAPALLLNRRALKHFEGRYE